MARQPDSLGFRFALFLALTVVVVTLMTWVAPQSLSKWAAPSERVTRFTVLSICICTKDFG